MISVRAVKGISHWKKVLPQTFFFIDIFLPVPLYQKGGTAHSCSAVIASYAKLKSVVRFLKYLYRFELA